MKKETFTLLRKAKCYAVFAFFLLLSSGILAQYPAGSPVAINGKLKLVGNQLSNECGNPVQLRGMSTHGPQWFPGCYNTSSLDALSKDWGADILRLAMYVREGGYTNNPSYWKGWIDNMVNECGKRGIYCLIDWHILNPGDPWADIAAARDFWSYMSSKHSGKKHVLYEICNEPNGVDWSRVKSYADDIIPRIRANDPSTVIIVGTPNWSQDVDIAANNKLNYSNIMYTLHFYSGTHSGTLRSKANTALSRGIGIFITEFGTSQASGDGGPYLSEAQTWLDWAASNKISWVNWSFSDKSEVSAALNPGSCGGNWNNTSQSGSFVKQRMLSPADNFVCNNSNPPPPVSQGPYGGTAASIPGKIEAEKYDVGGSTVAYSDATAGNSGNAFRTDDVDVEVTTDAGGGYNIGWTEAGEWLEYTVNVTASGTYDFEARVAATAAGKSFRIEMNGTSMGTIVVPNTGDWQSFATVTLTGVNLTTGQKVMRIYCVTDGFNLNYINVKSAWTPPPPTNQAPTVSLTSPANNASFTAPATIAIAANASDADGSVSKVEFFSGSTKLGEDLTSPYSFSWSNVAAGSYSITAKATDNAGAAKTSAAVTVIVNPVSVTQSPYGGSPAPIPGKVEIERYDLGGNGVAYNDATAGNSGNAFRTDDVDIEATTDVGGGYNIGWTEAGEWLEYTVNVTASGTYDFEARVAATAAGKSFRIEMNGTSIGTIAVPNTGGWQTFATVSITGVNLTAGQKVMRLYCITDGFNVNYVNVQSAGTPPSVNQAPIVSLSSPANNASFTAPATIAIVANASDADGSVSKVEFFSGSTKLGEDLTSPYSFTWSNVSAGSYSITAKATDNAGAVTTSSAVSVTVTAVNTDPCPAVAVPSASQFVLRNDWSDQTNGSQVSNTTDALKITHRQWGRNTIWMIQTGKNISIQSGKSYTISFDFKNDASNPVSSIDVGFAKGLNWDSPVLAQPTVSAGAGGSSSSYITKTVSFTATYTGTVNLAVLLNWPGQPNQQVNVYLKNLSECSGGNAVKMNASAFDDQSETPVSVEAIPNPFENSTVVKVSDGLTVPVTIIVNDLSGFTMQELQGYTNENIPLGAGLPAGVYVVQASYEGKTVVFRIVKN